MRKTDLFPVQVGWRILLRDLGINAMRVLQRAGLPQDLFIRENAAISTEEYFALWHLGLLTGAATTVHRARGVLLELLPAGESSMQAVARKLGMSKRTLQRRLTEEQQGFQQLLDQTREELARYYLKTTKLSGAEISFLIGYEHPSSFFRAFSEWTGKTAEQVRNLATA